ncbi:hypothetical protein SAMN05216464_103245 [Mucilaginibacter pineti]|uniref:GAF domain-containing protein n=1 Tax=Mucilaginibacter pineti TaxID=1391627 RepID=A0A1G6Z939_9SPHI|nr:GAF domain-containing protein [Mucilaginibacter pineti]SDD98507.1 hypothetical protein SAMN05216464_103245 [Mucilaginibacter pineti]
METEILNKAIAFPDEQLSFEPIVAYLQALPPEANPLRQPFLTEAAKQIIVLNEKHRKDPSGKSAISALIKLIDETLSFRLEQRTSFEFYTRPTWNGILHLKTGLPGLLQSAVEHDAFLKGLEFRFHHERELQLIWCYRAIWNHFADFPPLLAAENIFSFQSESDGCRYYYQLDTDDRFMHVTSTLSSHKCRQAIADIDATSLSEKETFQQLMERLPLAEFTFTGFGRITVTDITVPHMTKQIARQVVTDDGYTKSPGYPKDVREALHQVSGSRNLRFGLLTMFQLNGKFIFSGQHTMEESSTNFSDSVQKNLFDYLVNVYRLKPSRIYLEEITDDIAEKHEYLKARRDNGIRSFALLPVFLHGRLVGVLEVLAKNGKDLTKNTLSQLETFFPVLSAIFSKSITSLEQSLEQIIKNKFTSLQPAVQWRFNNADWRYLENSETLVTATDIEDIEFDRVYPLYGAVDIKNSTINRNRALRADAVYQLQLLGKTLSVLKTNTAFSLLDEKIAACKKWQKMVHDESRALLEGELDFFLENDIYCFIKELVRSKPGIAAYTENYFNSLDELHGKSSEQRRLLEGSMNQVIGGINELIDQISLQAQVDFPCLFEKFRTDGVEYDIYIGQSLAPDRPFYQIFIQNLRLLQLTNMIAIAHRTQRLQPGLPVPVEITQLIFVNPNVIDIRFRRDERRFDVEGAYNIRYHIVKKRIDKVLIKNSTERLTCPGKIAIVYTNQREADEYLVHIRYLQSELLITPEVELLELEQLQGVIGLKAIRVAILYPE